MKYCPEENFTQLAEAIERIEQHIGILTSLDTDTIRGQLNTSFQGVMYDSNQNPIALVQDGLIKEVYYGSWFLACEDFEELLCEDGEYLLT